ncbi:MAG: helix-turn-helix transcriptional regulator [Synergistaceae bacterium]|nr:helix-turn-helix transcriptional regulator [Synergistaceae bacterium]
MSRVRKVRRGHYLTLQELGQQIGVRQSLLTMIERRDRRARPDVQAALSSFFGIPATVLFDSASFAR